MVSFRFDLLRYTHGIEVENILKRDNYSCVICGSTTDLCIDHIVSVRDKGKSTVENQRILCRSCHSKITNTKEKVSKSGAYLREWRKRNPNYFTEYHKKWRKKHPGYSNAPPEKYQLYKASI